MRFLVILLGLLILAGCKDPDVPELNCDSFDYTEMTPSQRTHAVAFCNEQIAKIEDQTMTARLKAEAASVNMPLDKFLETRAGVVALVKELAAVIVGVTLVIGGWIAGMTLIRLATWEEDHATRRKWGPFSMWEIKYRRRKSVFLDIQPIGWLAIIAALGGIVSLIIYFSIVN